MSDQRFAQLLEGYCEDTLTQAERRELSNIVAKEQGKRDRFCQQVCLHVELTAHSSKDLSSISDQTKLVIAATDKGNRTDVVSLVKESILPVAPATTRSQQQHRNRRSRSKRTRTRGASQKQSYTTMLAVAACILIGLMTGSWYLSKHTTGSTTPPIFLHDEQQQAIAPDQWYGPFAQAQRLQAIDDSRYVLSAGCRMRYQAQQRIIEIQNGSLQAHVQKQSHAWTYRTRYLDVTVTGTQFTLTDQDPSQVTLHEGSLNCRNRLSQRSMVLQDSGSCYATADGQLTGSPAEQNNAPPQQMRQRLLYIGQATTTGRPNKHDALFIDTLSAEFSSITYQAGLTPPKLAQLSAANFDMVFISDSIASQQTRIEPLRSWPMPIICTEAWCYPRLGWTAAEEDIDFGGSAGAYIQAQSHSSIALAINDRLPLTTAPQAILWGRPAQSAISLAHLRDHPERKLLFIYLPGTPDYSGQAVPHLRIGCSIARFATDLNTPFDAHAFKQLLKVIRFAQHY